MTTQGDRFTPDCKFDGFLCNQSLIALHLPVRWLIIVCFGDYRFFALRRFCLGLLCGGRQLRPRERLEEGMLEGVRLRAQGPGKETPSTRRLGRSAC